MAHTQKRAVRAGTAPLHIPKLASLDMEDIAAPAVRQAPIDVVGLIASRSRVHPATIQAHLDAFGFAGCR